MWLIFQDDKGSEILLISGSTEGTDESTADDIKSRQNGGTKDKNSAKTIPEHKQELEYLGK